MTGSQDEETVTSEGGQRPVGHAKPRRHRRFAPHWPRRTWSRVTLGALVLAVVPLTWSIGHALTMPGGGTFSERLAEWARDHDLGPLVTLGERLTYQAPKVGGAPSFALTAPSPVTRPHAQARPRRHD